MITDSCIPCVAEYIPSNFLRANGNNRNKAAKKWAITKKWRADNDIDNILSNPQPHFNVIKSQYPQHLHGKAINGDMVSVELPGKFILLV